MLFALEVFSRFLLEGSVVDGPRQMVEVSIPEGATIDSISTILKARNLIEHPVLFRYAVRVMGADTKIQAGNMLLASGQSLFELIRNLSRTKGIGIPVTLPEGRTCAEIAGILAARIGVDSAAFMALVRDTSVVRSLGLEGPSLEGYIFPDTYFIAVGTDPRRIVNRMVANLRNHLPKDFEAQAQRLGMNLHEVMTLASIVEWETFTKSEARTIASVYLNRLKKDMPLQADPTVSYALGKGPARLFNSDLRVDSPYNTYLHAGLPPGPINNPGRFAIDATLHPETTNYLFFVARGDGMHAFTTTFSDHLIAKQQLDRIRREAAQQDTTARGVTG